MKKLAELFNRHAETILLVPILSSMVLFIFLQVLFRYVIKQPLAWSEELARFLFVWMIYVGASVALTRGRIMKVDILEHLLRKHRTAKYAVALLSDAVSFLFCLTITYYSFLLTMEVITRDRRSIALDIPMAFSYAALPVGFALMSFRLLQSFLVKIGRLKSGVPDPVENIDPADAE